MTCPDCREEIAQFPCRCGYAPKQLEVVKKSNWIIQHCSTRYMIEDKEVECGVAIRVRVGQQEEAPLCNWCKAGSAYMAVSREWPAGMPNPELPWPWLDDRERERRLRLPFWRDRFKQHATFYAKWITTKSGEEVAP